MKVLVYQLLMFVPLLTIPESVTACDDIKLNGWTAVPINASQLFNGQTYNHVPSALKVRDMQFPADDPVVQQVQHYVRERFPRETYNHSMRSYYYASAIVRQQFPEVVDSFSLSTLAMTALLHDLGTTDENMAASHMSFEFYGALKAATILEKFGASHDQADAVCEAIIRHQDLGTEGNITFLGQVIQLATIFDNVSDHPYLPDIKNLIHIETREDVIQAFPRFGWLGCFAKTVQQEISTKPWSHTTHIPNFDQKILGNSLMKQYECKSDAGGAIS
ncbi:hypothetical protein BB8028_0001g12330 [Beauveria bassiana]|uniref:HD domain-containing protein n=1 Tax=Beauveria bassiana TaxID=176275 RepID=A0A2S7XZV7_BEABA|nr:hypothetical protein BB8028_0001g12330 [Beauveria bassiana]